MADEDKSGQAGDGDDTGNDGGGEKDTKSPALTDLDSVHEFVSNEHGASLIKPDEDEDTTGDGDGDGDDAKATQDANDDDTAAGDGDDGAGDGDVQKDDTAQGDAKDEDTTGDGDGDGDDAKATGADEDQDKDTSRASKQTLEEPEAPEAPDTDPSKPGKYKATFKDADGNVFHVGDLDELPDDFEPESQKSYGKALQDLTKKQMQFDTDTQQYQKSKTDFDTDKQVGALRESWDADIADLTKKGELPKDTSERQKVVEGVYGLMESEMKAGRMVNSWAHAFEMYSYRQGKTQKTEQTVAKNNAKKKAGGRVMSSGSSGAPRKGKMLEGPPPGVGLDAVHEKVMGNL